VKTPVPLQLISLPAVLSRQNCGLVKPVACEMEAVKLVQVFCDITTWLPTLIRGGVAVKQRVMVVSVQASRNCMQ